MKAAILAAGLGSRLQPITNHKPKCMVKVQGETLLERQLSAFLEGGIEEVYIVTGYRSELIDEKYIKRRFKKMEIHFIQNDLFETTNNMYSLYLLKTYLYNQSFVLCNGDIIYDNQIFVDLVNSSYPDLIAVEKNTYMDESMKIKVNNDNLIVDISKALDESASYGVSIDMYKFSMNSAKVLFDRVETIINVENNLKDWTEVAIQSVLKERLINMQPYPINNYRWVEIDNYNDLALADMKFHNLSTEIEDAVFFIDLDGTLMKGQELIPGADEFINYLNKNEIPYFLLSNNSSYSKLELIRKMKTFGMEVDERKIILSTDGLIAYLLDEGALKTYTIGTNAMIDYLESNNIETDAETPDFVVLGYDTELNYQKIKKASKFLNQGIPMLATHFDVNCPTPDGPIPDIGSFINMFSTALGVSPYKIFGKPNIEMLSFKLEQFAQNHPARTPVVIGDRLYTDMEMARRLNIDFICVLSGEASREEIDKLDYFPNLTVKSVKEILQMI
ncbi:HAD-IIA family hydrolase [Paenibacillus sp. IITD108]|uniref:HAD-IIA family hydrolase n=1 Tax=Paenibacillus sp. IITD108 TaxID=3116649 RepID=UPI002F404297